MTVRIADDLKADPGQVQLPRRVTLTQKLYSTQPPEKVKIDYRLTTHHRFVGGATPTKTVSRDETVAGTSAHPSVIRHQLTVDVGPEEPRHQWVVIQQDITDSSGQLAKDVVAILVK